MKMRARPWAQSRFGPNHLETKRNAKTNACVLQSWPLFQEDMLTHNANTMPGSKFERPDLLAQYEHVHPASLVCDPHVWLGVT